MLAYTCTCTANIIVPPFNKEPHDHYLALDICRGLRPKIREKTPPPLKELIQKCWDANPANRPTSKEVLKQFKSMNINEGELSELSYDSDSIESLSNPQLSNTHPQAIYTSRPLKLEYLPEPVNCSNHENFISSRIVQTGKL